MTTHPTIMLVRHNDRISLEIVWCSCELLHVFYIIPRGDNFCGEGYKWERENQVYLKISPGEGKSGGGRNIVIDFWEFFLLWLIVRGGSQPGGVYDIMAGLIVENTFCKFCPIHFECARSLADATKSWCSHRSQPKQRVFISAT